MDKTLPPTGVTAKQQREFLNRLKDYLNKLGGQAVVVYTWPEDGEQYVQTDSYGLANILEAVGILEAGKMSALRVLPNKRKGTEAGNDKPVYEAGCDKPA